ncbi:hypothetical protein [Kineococcus sp. SYSU DK003]|uniref:hypothetical protein n=1 Tax=Kineococcus sp. SYSU DK003 TaxID=3383124 RepID=UPI003D7D4188
MSVAHSLAWTATVLPRLLLVVAVTLGLCAMHVFAAAVDQHHAAVHAAASSPATAMTHASPDAPTKPATSADASAPSAQVAAQVTTQAAGHDHHGSMADCALFLSAGIALLVVFLAWAVARALRPSYWLADPWPKKVIAGTPWRGPPPWRWPRTSLCVIRV